MHNHAIITKATILLTNVKRTAKTRQQTAVFSAESPVGNSKKHPLRRMIKSGAVCRGEEHFLSSSATSPAPVTRQTNAKSPAPVLKCPR